MSRLTLTSAVLLVVCGFASLVSAGEAEPKAAPDKQPAPAAKAEPKADAPAAPKPPPPPPLYSRAGGASAIAPMGEDLAERLLADKALGENAQIKGALAKANKAALRFQATALLCQMAGGPERYSGPLVFDLFKSLSIADKDWAAFVAVFEKALEAAKTPADQQKEWLDQLEGIHKALLDAVASEPVDYQNKEKSFTIAFPKNWDRKENIGGAAVMATSPEDPANKDALRAQVAVVVDELPLEITAEEFAKASALEGSKRFKEFKVLDRTPVTAGKLSAYRLIVSHRMGEAAMRVITLYFVNGKRGYAINCVASADQADRFASYFETICRRFKLDGDTPK